MISGTSLISGSIVGFLSGPVDFDDLWDRLSEGGEKQQCGWLQDKYGVSWQIVPSVLGRMLRDPNPARSQRVMQALMEMS